MKKILVFQHVAWEILGTLDPLLRDLGFRIRYCNFHREPDLNPSLEGYDGLVVLGGPMNVDEEHKHPHLKRELKIIEQALTNETPILGICLGAQLIAKAMGSEVKRNHSKEIGWHGVELTPAGQTHPCFQGYAPSENLFHWHGDTFDIPKQATHLAKSSLCTNQAFHVGDNVLGLQFHLEVDEAMIHRWLSVPHMKEDLMSCCRCPDEAEFLSQTKQNIDRLKTLSQSTFAGFFEKFAPNRHIKLGTR